MVYLRRHVARFSFWNRRNAKVFLQVQDKPNGPWRDADAQDLSEWEDEQKFTEKVRVNQGYFPIGVRVLVNGQSGFSRGSKGVVQFQEPNQGKVWVLRDGASGPCFFMGHELDIEHRQFTAPAEHTLALGDGCPVTAWWIRMSIGLLNADRVQQWCINNSIADPILQVVDYDDPKLYLVGFKDRGDAMLFYMRFR